ncbi:hypothetical protein NDU88_003059 [Pleurodeles waltl]|uniref:Uncharacterized protein n=1 Tax=Pleurodeles waltl TaxID=8319 RepID=A0AAV7M460_PLEWA|nr:hypothetical protein NDU88_003059 [Pleurodeles waltl]
MASHRPQSFLGPRPCSIISPLCCPTERAFRWATVPQSASLPPQGDSAGVPRYLRASEPPRPAAQPGGATSISGPLSCSPEAARLRGRRLVAPRLGATIPGLPGSPPVPPLPLGSSPGVPRRSEPSALTPLRIAAPCEAAALAARSGLRLPISPTGRFRHSPGSPQEPTHARSPPSASPHSLDLDRPGEVTVGLCIIPAGLHRTTVDLSHVKRLFGKMTRLLSKGIEQMDALGLSGKPSGPNIFSSPHN